MSTNPNTVKSLDELNEGGRKSDVLIATIEELEKVKKENELFKEIIKDEMIKNGEIIEEIERLQKQLDIAKSFIFRCANDIAGDWYVNAAKCVMQKIEKLNK